MARNFVANGQLQTVVNTRISNAPFFTISFWLYRQGTPVGGSAHIVRTSVGAGSGWGIDLTTGNLLSAYIDASGNQKQRTSATIPTLNTWVHVAAVHQNTGNNSTDWVFYFNGVSEAGTNVTAMSGTRGSVALAFILGDDSFDANYTLGPVAFWDCCLSPSAILGLAGGAHPSEYPDCLVDTWDLMSEQWETGATGMYPMGLTTLGSSPPATAVNPPVNFPSRWPYQQDLQFYPLLLASREYQKSSGAAALTLSITDTISTGSADTAADAIARTDGVTLAAVLANMPGKPFAESALVLADVIAEEVNTNQTDAIALAAAYLVSISKPLTADTLSLAASLSNQSQKALAETAMVFADVVSTSNGLSQTAVLTLAAALVLAATKNLTATITVADSLSASIAGSNSYTKGVSDALTLGDSSRQLSPDVAKTIGKVLHKLFPKFDTSKRNPLS